VHRLQPIIVTNLRLLFKLQLETGGQRAVAAKEGKNQFGNFLRTDPCAQPRNDAEALRTNRVARFRSPRLRQMVSVKRVSQFSIGRNAEGGFFAFFGPNCCCGSEELKSCQRTIEKSAAGTNGSKIGA
jgi:hypothetical protein